MVRRQLIVAMFKVDLGRGPGVRHTPMSCGTPVYVGLKRPELGTIRRRKLPQQVPPLNPSILVAVDFLSQVSRNQHSWR